MEPALLTQMESLERRYNELAELMGTPEAGQNYAQLQELNKERTSISRVVGLYRDYVRAVRQLAEAEEMARYEEDEGLRSLARAEVGELTRLRDELESAIRLDLLPKDPNDERNVFVEVRAGTGGEEAALFAGELYRMYLRYAQRQGWKTELADSSPTGIGGMKEVVFGVRGKGVYSRLKYESGVHRVQRVPATEASGRIHTSTVTVAVLPEAEEVEVKIAPEDIKVDIFHAGGHGGQNVQKVATAVRLTHLPTGIVVVCRDERSQLQNRIKAMSVLRSRVYQLMTERQQQEVVSQRRVQVGTGERAEKIRTYNFPQNRVTDHRIGLTVHNLPAVLEGDLNELIDAVALDDQRRRLEEALAGQAAPSR